MWVNKLEHHFINETWDTSTDRHFRARMLRAEETAQKESTCLAYGDFFPSTEKHKLSKNKL